jgi:hypothetical protein
MNRRTMNDARLCAATIVLALAAPLFAQGVPDGTKVRILASGLRGGWLDGKVQMNRSSGCTMVVLDKKQPGGYTMVALNAVGKMERQEKGAWVEIAVKPLLAKEKKECREAAND